MRCQDCGRDVKACRAATKALIRAGLGDYRTDQDHRPSRKPFAAEPEPVRELSVADWIGGAA